MQSLRTRRSQAAPHPQRPTANKASRAPTTRRDGKSRIDSKIKKRMSTLRYAGPDISGPTGLIIPPVPSMRRGDEGVQMPLSREIYEDAEKRREDEEEQKRTLDRKMLDSQEFDADAYLKTKLSNSTEMELRSLQSSLRAAREETATDLQKNVFKNYAEFVLISKEISTLENEMIELKESLSEWKAMPSLLHIDDSASAADRRRAARSSIADLRVLYANQMQSLHTTIEGAAKFAPTTPGRHVVAEVDGVTALNAATYKTDHAVRFVVLDDAVLIARKRRQRGGGEGGGGSSSGGRLVAEKCWPLNEMLVLDTKDTPSMTNVFKIRHGKETHVYRTELSSEKKSLLSQFRSVAEELAAKKRKEREGELERRKSLWGGGDRMSLAFNPDKMPAMPDWMADLQQRSEGDGTSAKEKSERDGAWVSEWSDDLTVAIALRDWEKAVLLVEQGKSKLSTTPPLAAKYNALSAQLTSSLLSALSNTNNRKTTVISLIGFLQRLNAGPAARATFLGARTEAIRKIIRVIRFEGHVGTYINDLAMVVFMGVKHTADWFLASFRENEVASGFIDWAKREIELFAEIFRKQVYSTDVDYDTVEKAKDITFSQSKKLLQEYGLDFRFLLDDLLSKNPKEAPKPAPRFSAQSELSSRAGLISPNQESLSLPHRTLTPRITNVPSSSSPSLSPSSAVPPPSLPTRFARSLSSSSGSPPPDSPEAAVAPTPGRSRSPAPGTIPHRTGSAGRVAQRPPPLPQGGSWRAESPKTLAAPLKRTESPAPPLSARLPPAAPPPRSSNRPGSTIRIPSAAIPKREGMF